MIHDMMYNILLQADINIIRQLCQINKSTNEICNSEHFWLTKFKQDGLEGIVNFNDLETYSYLDLYQMSIDTQKDAFNILHINKIEKNRKDNKTEGIFKIKLEDRLPIKYWFPHIIEDYNEIIFELLDNEYDVKIMHDNDIIDLGKFSINYVKKILPSILLYNECYDKFNYSFIYKEVNEFDYIKQFIGAFPIQKNQLLLRQGMWQILNEL